MEKIWPHIDVEYGSRMMEGSKGIKDVYVLHLHTTMRKRHGDKYYLIPVDKKYFSDKQLCPGEVAKYFQDFISKAVRAGVRTEAWV